MESLYTIGHSTRPIAEFIELLRDSSIEVVVDVRTMPRSRTNPQYNRDVLPASLAAAGIAYEHLPALGGLRGRSKETPPDVNAYWQNESFHNYADYALTTAFRQGLDALRALARERRVAIMCSEAVWWRCHRRIVSDYLLHAGVRVHHIQSKARIEPAQITPAAKPGPGGTLTYPPESSLF